MGRKWLALSAAITAVVLASGTALAGGEITLFVNHQKIESDAAPLMEQDRVFVPIRWVAEALGADVKWEEDRQSVSIEDRGRQSAEARLQLLEQFLSPASAAETADMWAKAVQKRNGAVQFSLLSPELQELTIDGFEEMHWVPGVSSPWTNDYTVTALSSQDETEQLFRVEFHMATSTGNAGSGSVQITVGNRDGKWLITDMGKAEGTSYPDLILPEPAAYDG